MKKILSLIFVCLSFVINGQSLKLLWKSDTVFRTPESVLYDDKNDMLYISNINGKSSDKDGNGFISKVKPDGTIVNLHWADSLDAPKGMGLYKNELFVADISRVVRIDLKTGLINHVFEIDSAQFLNDITVDSNGTVYISDSATGKIYAIKDGSVKLHYDGRSVFKRVNGLLAIPRGLYIADAGTGVNYKWSKLALLEFTTTSQGADGIVEVCPNEYVVSSWGGEIFYVDKNGKATKMLDTKEAKINSADIGFNKKTNTVYVPTFFANAIMAYSLEGVKGDQSKKIKK